MAKAKKKSAKATKKTVRRAAPKPRLDKATRASKLKPGDSLNELIGETLTAWAGVRKKVRVPDVTPAKLTSLGKKSDKARKRENDLAAKQAAKLAPLSDARIVADDAAYRAVLAVKRLADAIAKTDPAVAHAFAKVTDRFKTGGSTAAAQPPAKPAS
jgi:hypothetical protein